MPDNVKLQIKFGKVKTKMEDMDNEKEQVISKYIYDRYGRNIKDGNIFYGQAIIPIDMLIKQSIVTHKLNPDKDIFYIVDHMFDYFCT